MERDAERANDDGHEASFAAGAYRVRGDVDLARERLILAAQHYSLAAHCYAEAAVERLRDSRRAGGEQGSKERELACAGCGNAAAAYWYAGRAYADAAEFERAAEAMAAAAGSYVAEAQLREEHGGPSEGFTLRRMANFRYLDAARYFMQAVAAHTGRSEELQAEGRHQNAALERSRAERLERRARDATCKAGDEAPKYHAEYQQTYQGG